MVAAKIEANETHSARSLNFISIENLIWVGALPPLVTMNKFGLNRRVEAFDNRIVPAIAFAAHAASHAVIFELLLERALLNTGG